MGNPRSGTTLFIQWLGISGYLAYPTNLLSRFYGVPCIGAKIQLMLTKHDSNNDLFDFNNARGGLRAWRTYKLPGYVFLEKRKPYERTAGQVCCTEVAVEKGLERVAAYQVLSEETFVP